MPKLWSETIRSHRHEVREAILDAAWSLVTERGLTSVKMSHIAQDAGIGRATLYKYFPDVEAILIAWHERHVAGHLEELTSVARGEGAPRQRFGAVLEAYALITREVGRSATELDVLLHQDQHVVRAKQQLTDLVRDLLAEMAQHGEIRDDLSADDLASYCMHALAAAATMSTEADARRLVTVVIAGLQPRR